MNRRTALIFYVLSVYVVVQFVWWGYHLIELTSQINDSSDLVSKRVVMIIGEGAIFLLLLLIGIWQIRRSIKKELALSKRQKNFLLSVTHELKTPLAANKLYIQTVTKRNLNQKQTNELLTKAIDENSRLEQMIDNILNASRLENKVLDPTKEDVDFNLLSNQIKKRFGALSSVAEIKLEIDKDLRLFADQQMISSILSNLVENALKYARNDHPIVIYGHSAPNNAATFGVKDLGPGIPKELKQDVFKKFYRLDNEETRSQKGTGLGLYIVSQLVEIQGGTIRCIDNEPNGVNFEIQMNHAE